MEYEDQLISKDTFIDLLTKLTKDDRERVKLLFGKNFKRITDACQADGNQCHFYRNSEIWIEVLCLIQRFDLLRVLGVCKFQAKQRLQDRTYVPYIRKYLLNIFENITDEDALRIKCGRSQNWNLCDWLLEMANEDELVNNLKKIFENLGWDDLVVETILYQTRFPDGEVPTADPFKLELEQDIVRSYPIAGSPVGICVIINIHRFKNPGYPERTGSLIDKKSLRRSFKEFDFKVEHHDNLTLDELEKVVAELSMRDHSEFSAFVFCIMSHGERGTVVTYDCKLKSVNEIIEKICICETLKGKPKLFYVQACQGNDVQDAVNQQPKNERASADCACNKLPTADNQNSDAEVITGLQDMCLSYATVDRCRAFRTEEEGSWFVKALTDALNSCGDVANMGNIAVEVNQKVGEKTLLLSGKSPQPVNVGQTPVCSSTLRQLVIFKRKRSE